MKSIRQHFPLLNNKIYGKEISYLDTASTCLKPQHVIDRLSYFYSNQSANVHRGVHYLSGLATDLYDAARVKCGLFINAGSSSEVIFTKGTTDGVNFIAATYGASNISEGDEILITEMEHHSNIIPWQVLCKKNGAILKVIPIDDTGNLEINNIDGGLINSRTKIVSITHMSNVLGTVNDIKYICSIAHKYGAITVVDGAQAIAHMKIDVTDLGCDFYVFSGHKLYGPNSVGILYGKKQLLDNMEPYQTGGGMIRSCSFNETVYAAAPEKFEAGTPQIAEAIGLASAIDFIEQIGINHIEDHENALLDYAIGELKEINGLKIIGMPHSKKSVIAFTMDDIHPHDIGTILDSDGIAIRAGHHCAQPLHTKFSIAATARISFGCYNIIDDVNRAIKSLYKVKEIFC